MQDRPTAIELLQAAAAFVDREIVPVTEGTRQFQSRVVANVMRIVARELELEEAQTRQEVTSLARLLGRPVSASTSDEWRGAALRLSEELCGRVRAGDADSGPWRKLALRVVRESVENKLRIANPRYLEADLAARASRPRP